MTVYIYLYLYTLKMVQCRTKRQSAKLTYGSSAKLTNWKIGMIVRQWAQRLDLRPACDWGICLKRTPCDRGQKNRPKKCVHYKKIVNGDGLLTLRPFSKCTWHNASSCMMCLFFQEWSSKLAGSPNLMVGKPSTPTSSPNSTDQSPDMSLIFPESTLRTPTHGFSITNAVLQMLYGGKHLWHVATCFDKKPQLVTLHMSHMSSSKYCIFHPPTRAPHRPRGWRHDRRIASSAYPMQVSWPKKACSMVLVRLIQAKLWGKRWNSSWLHATLVTFQCQKKGVPKFKFLQNMFGTKKLRGLSTF